MSNRSPARLSAGRVRSNPRTIGLALALLGAFVLCGCGVKSVHRTTVSPEDFRSLDGKSPYLKCHMKDGGVYVLSPWNVLPGGRSVHGHGKPLDPNRRAVGDGDFTVDIAAVALFETNIAHRSAAVTGLAIVTGISLGITAYCIANPKSCFGSCPTFYVSDGQQSLLQAEGFSASVAPSLEATDVDALYRARVVGGELVVRMKNEALETHVVRFVNVLVLPRTTGGRTFAVSSGKFREARALVEPTRCVGGEGEMAELVRRFDGVERFSAADSTDLATREVLELEFGDVPDGEIGLVVGCRQSLLSTYLFYQTLAHMGRSAGTWIAEMERSPASLGEKLRGLSEELGKVEVLVPDEHGEWRSIGSAGETGPLATDVRLVEIPRPPVGAGPLRVRLRLTRGLWRLDYVALASLGAEVEPVRISPLRVLRDGVEDVPARELLAPSDGALTTLPGDEYELVYELPESGGDKELFLESRGYYLEWMREEWMPEEDHARAVQILVDPRAALRVMAAAFKEAEPEMETTFWNSRYAAP